MSFVTIYEIIQTLKLFKSHIQITFTDTHTHMNKKY